jgi:protein-L-isoaspartate(D-aspartate) O-methyltransferase
LRDLGYENANFRIGDGHEGWHEKSPFDAVIVTAAPPKVPQTLLNQLKIGGRLVIPVGDTNQDLVLIHRTQNGYERKKMLPVAFVPMTGEPQNKGEPS